MIDFVKFLVSQIVTKPEEVIVEQIQNGEWTVYLVSVNKEDMGSVIGKEGRTIKSIRNLVKAKAILEGARVNVEIKEVEQTA